jgi:hypothetical protein
MPRFGFEPPNGPGLTVHAKVGPLFQTFFVSREATSMLTFSSGDLS